MTERIMALCGAMGANEDQEELLLPLVQAVRDQLAGRLRPGIMPEQAEEMLAPWLRDEGFLFRGVAG